MYRSNSHIDNQLSSQKLETILTPDQLRAARALVNVTQHDVAKRAGISRNAINNFERGHVVPRIETLKILRQTMELYGVEFEGSNGLRKVSERFDVECYEGPDYMDRLLAEERREIIEGRCRSLYITNINNASLTAEELKEISGEWLAFRQKHNIDERILVREDHLFFIQPKKDYRLLPPDVAGEVPSLIFGDTLAIIVSGEPVKLVLIKNPSIAETYRRQFLAQWNLARPLTQSEYTKGVARANNVLRSD